MMKIKALALVIISALTGFLGHRIGFSVEQSVIVSVFMMSIIGTLFFWDVKLSFAFIGAGVLLSIGAVNMEDFIRFASLDVILFLIAMMIIVGMMKDAGFFEWLITLVLRVKRLSGWKMFAILMIASAVFSSLMGEVASIIVMTMVILNICDFLDEDPLPLVISSVMATNIGSASTVLGNPVGVLIAARGNLSFEDFLTHALPVSLVVLVLMILVMAGWFRRYLASIDRKIKVFGEDKGFLYLISIPPDIRTRVSIGIFLATIVLIGFHRRFELMLGLEHNTMLIVIPVVAAGIVMVYRYDRARYYIEHEVEWPSLLFFMFLFAQAGVIQASGIADLLADKLFSTLGNSPSLLAGIVLLSSGFLSSILDNVVTVASYVPIITSLDAFHVSLKPLWWALLFGACYGGNITMIGSTANIVALGLLEKECHIKVTAMMWLKIGALVGFLSMAAAYIAIAVVPSFQ